ncbi:isoprenoid synthase domain-containing protein [Flagelloscypha sp. PMI_526]|nr:isoprenoid synthase domain-containing protein [Flagelloscypha sp. PMI_526]
MSTMQTARCVLPNLVEILGISPDLSEVDERMKDPQDPVSIATKQHEEWIDSQTTYSFIEKKMLKRARVALAASKMYPFASVQQLEVIIHFLTTTFVIDAVLDRESNHTNEKLGHVWQRLVESGGNLKKFTKEEESLPHVRSIAVLARGTLPHLGPLFRDKYISGLVDYINSRIYAARVRRDLQKEQSMYKDTPLAQSFFDPRTPAMSTEAYIRNRRETVGTRTAVHIVRWAYGIILTDEELSDPRFEKMVTCTGEIASMANDLYSLKKEFLSNPFHPLDNLVYVAVHDPSTGLRKPTTFNEELQAGVDYLAKAFTESYRVYQEQIDSLIDDPPACAANHPEFKDMVKKYGRATIEVAAASCTWSMHGSLLRYNVFTTEENRRNSILEFSLPQTGLLHLLRTLAAALWLSREFAAALICILSVLLFYFVTLYS